MNNDKEFVEFMFKNMAPLAIAEKKLLNGNISLHPFFRMTLLDAYDYYATDEFVLGMVEQAIGHKPTESDMSSALCFRFGLNKSDIKKTADTVLQYDDVYAYDNGIHRVMNYWYWFMKVKIPYNEKDFVETPKPVAKPKVTCTNDPSMGSGYTTDNSTGVEYTCINGRIFFRNVTHLPLDFNILTQMARKNKDTYLTESFSVKTLPTFLSWMVHDSGIYQGDGEQAASQVARDIASLLSKGNYKSIYNQYKQFIDELLKKN